ncbi:MAG: FecR domain-containing protein [Bacteroidota bacterium]
MKVTPELLKKYAEGKCTEAEKEFIENWLPGDVDIASELSEEKVKHATAQMWQEITADIDDNPTSVTIPLYKRVMRYAAAVIILFTIGFFTHNYLTAPVEQGDLAYFEDYSSIHTQRGQKRTVKLSDGSTIRMNYETEIKAPEKFEGDQRVVYLTGQAHFDVARDTERPFIIYTKDTKTQVLGTSFDINTKNEGETRIIVTSGEVAFSEKNQQDNLVTLTLNDRAVLGADRNITTDEVDALALTAWKDNQLIFEDQSLAEIIETIEPWYNVTVDVSEEQRLDKHYTLSFDDPNIELLMEQMSFLGEFQYEIEGDQIIIY